MAAAERFPITPPDGIDHAHVDRVYRLSHHSSILSLGVLGLVLAIGLSGRLGVTRESHRREAPAARVELTAAKVLRSGSFVETRVQVRATQDIGELVLAFEPSLWRDLTTNAIVPAPAEEVHADGLLRLGFDPLAAGETFELQIQQQVNPSRIGPSRGRFVVLDGERVLLEIPLAYQVLP